MYPKTRMIQVQSSKAPLSPVTKFSYVFMVGVLVAVVGLRLATPLLAALFAYLALRQLEWKGRGGRWIAVAVLLILLSAMAYAAGHFVRQTVRSLPEIADKSIPSILTWAKEHNLELPFSDYDSLKEFAIETVKGEAKYWSSFAKFARSATTEVVLLVAGCVVAISLFLNRKDGSGLAPGKSLYAVCWGEVTRRFEVFYQSFVTVMGAQLVISAINTVLTAVFVAVVHLPYGVVIIGVTFLCGLLPVVGNLISNTVVVAVGFTISPRMALTALLFLVIIHKLEYFLNSKIVGWRIHNPLWLTLLALIIGERLLGIAGLILAPVVLNYIRLEASDLSFQTTAAPARLGPEPKEAEISVKAR